MSEKLPSKDEALEALDFIVNVLKEHEKDLDRLVSELGTVADQMGENGEVNVKVKKIEDKITSLQADIGSLMKVMPRQETVLLQQAPAAVTSAKPASVAEANVNLSSGMPLQIQCNQWEDFQNLSAGAQAASFVCKESEKTVHINVIKSNQIVSFNGELPKLSTLLKVYLSKQLDLSEKQVLEGTIGLK